MIKVLRFLIFSSLITAILGCIFLIFLTANEGVEIRMSSLLTYVGFIIFGGLLTCFVAITVLALISKKKNWIRFTVIAFYTVFAIPLVIIMFKEKKLSPEVLIIAGFCFLMVLIIALALFTKGLKWQKYLLILTCSGLTTLVAVSIFKLAQKPSKKHVAEDNYTKYQSKQTDLKVIVQGKAPYLITMDFGLFRIRENFEEPLPDGKWDRYSSGKLLISTVTVKDGKTINEAYHLAKNSFMIESAEELRAKLLAKHKLDTITFFINRLIELEEPLIISHNGNIIFDSFLYQKEVGFRFKGHSGIRVTQANDIVIKNLKLSAEKNDHVIHVARSSDIRLQNCEIRGGTASAIYLDDHSRRIHLQSNKIVSEGHADISAMSKHLTLVKNSLGWEYSSKRKPVLFRDYKARNQLAMDITRKVIDSYKAGEYSQVNTFASINNKEYPVCDDLTLRDCGGEYHLSRVIKEYFHDNVNDGLTCYYPFCHNLFSYLTDAPSLYIDFDENLHDPWINEGVEYDKLSIVNPAFFRTLNLELPAQGTSEDELIRELYHKLIKKMVRNYFVAYETLQTQNMENAVEQFKEFVDDENETLHAFIFYTFLKHQEFDTVLDYYNDGNTLDTYVSKITVAEETISLHTFTDMMGFWLRREIDGSAPEIHALMVTLMHRYDLKWTEGEEPEILSDTTMLE